MRHADIILSQETKKQHRPFYHNFPDWKCFHNPYSSNKAGTDIWVSRSFLTNFHVLPIVLGKGYIQYLSFIPRKDPDIRYPIFTRSFAVVNIYLPASAQEKLKKKSLLTKLTKLRITHDYIFAAGDFNILGNKSDSAGGRIDSKEILNLLEATTKALNIREIYHPTHTYKKGPYTSRLDRHFTSHSLAEKDTMAPTISFPHHPHNPFNDSKSPSDHIPVLLSFASPTAHKRSKKSIPNWLAKDRDFELDIRKRWTAKLTSLNHPSKRPFQKGHAVKTRLALDDVILEAAKARMKRSPIARVGCDAKAHMLASSVYKDLLKGSIDAETAITRCAGSKAIMNSVKKSTLLEPLIKALDTFLNLSHSNALIEGVRPGGSPPLTSSTSSFSSKVKAHLPASYSSAKDYVHKLSSSLLPPSTHLPFFVSDEGDHITSPKAMAKTLKKTWKPIWSNKHIPQRNINAYLRSYKKKLHSPINDITIEDCRREIASPKSSCCGPNGIPFFVYAVIVDISAPIFFEEIKYLMSPGSHPNRRFNNNNLFFLPKDDSHRPDKTRPIAAGNTSNRIIANIVRRALSGPIYEILSKSQAGFIPGRSIEENINFFNKRLYSATETGRGAFHALFLDFAKAFDSISRKYLLSLLKKIGVPDSFCRLIESLFLNVSGKPILNGNHNVRIDMEDGLKQGCPLSPLFFILAIDPLLSHLELIRGTLPKCFADDLAIGFYEWKDIFPVFPLIDAWSAVTGCKPNIGKTKFISSVSEFIQVSSFVPHNWRCLQLASQYTYLGVLLGRDVTVEMVFKNALQKFIARVGSYLPSKPLYNLAGRVSIANTYMVPVFSYLFRFFLLDPTTKSTINKHLRQWTVHGNVTNLERLTAPTDQVGLKIPLKNIAHVNIATILRKREHILFGKRRPPDASMLLKSHTIRAARRFRRMTGHDPSPNECQKKLTHQLCNADSGPHQRLTRTLTQRYSRHGIDAPHSRISNILAHSSCFPPSLPTFLRSHMFDMVHGTLPTGNRLKHANGRDPGCRFCGHSQETMGHIFADCKVTLSARMELAKDPDNIIREAAQRIVSATAEDFALTTTHVDTKTSLSLVCFAWAVWRARWGLMDPTIGARAADLTGISSDSSIVLTGNSSHSIYIDGRRIARVLATEPDRRVTLATRERLLEGPADLAVLREHLCTLNTTHCEFSTSHCDDRVKDLSCRKSVVSPKQSCRSSVSVRRSCSTLDPHHRFTLPKVPESGREKGPPANALVQRGLFATLSSAHHKPSTVHCDSRDEDLYRISPVSSPKHLSRRGNSLSVIRHRFKQALCAFSPTASGRDRVDEKRCFMALLKSLPRSHHIYTDGSSFKHLNIAGAGFIIYPVSGPNISSSLHIGPGSNNLAEVWALLHLSRHLLSSPLSTSYPIYIFVDNRIAIKVALGATPIWCPKEASELHLNLTELSRTININFYWVPGHADILGNEAADKLAKSGAKSGLTFKPIRHTLYKRKTVKRQHSTQLLLDRSYFRISHTAVLSNIRLDSYTINLDDRSHKRHKRH